MNMEMSSLQICFREVVDRVGVYFRARVPVVEQLLYMQMEILP